MYSWMLYTPDALVLDLTDTNITSMQDIEQAFHALDLCPKEKEETKGKCSHGGEESRKDNKSK